MPPQEYLSPDASGDVTVIFRPVELSVPPDADEVFAWFAPGRQEGWAESGLYARRNSKHEDDVSGWLRFLGPCPWKPGDVLTIDGVDYPITSIAVVRVEDVVSIYEIAASGIDCSGLVEGFEIESDCAPGDDPDEFCGSDAF